MGFADLEELPSVPANTVAWNDAMPVEEAYSRRLGLAGPIAGVHGDYLLVGGGANFPEPGKMPNEANTLGKVYWNKLLVMDLTEASPGSRSAWPSGMLGYAATIGLPEGVLVIGGEGFPRGPEQQQARRYREVRRRLPDELQRRGGRRGVHALPAAASRSSYGAAALIDRTVYYQTGKDFYALDLDDLDAGWKALPAWPGEPRDTAVAAAIGGKFVLATGRTKADDGAWHVHQDAFASTQPPRLREEAARHAVPGDGRRGLRRRATATS